MVEKQVRRDLHEDVANKEDRETSLILVADQAQVLLEAL